MDQKQDYKEKYEKVKLHIIYLTIIAVILVVIGISIALGGNGEALGQISMASTVSSIILSAIAIFMSISGENKLSYTHNKLVETSDRMSGITDNIEIANSLLDNTINPKLTKIDDIFDRLERIGQSVDNVEKEVLSRTTLSVNENSTVTISSNVLWQVYNDMLRDQSTTFDKIVKAAIEYVIVCSAEGADLSLDSIGKRLKLVMGASNPYFEGYAWGIAKVFIYIGITNRESLKYFEERLDLSQAERDEIRRIL